MSGQWIDFKELRGRLKFADVLQSYNVELKVKGDRATGLCPLPGHPRHDGKQRSPSFSANLTRGLFNCFGCHAHGNAIDFACYMAGGDPKDPVAFRKAALELHDRFIGSTVEGKGKGATAPDPAAHPQNPATDSEAQQKPAEVNSLPVIVNAPLNFTLQKLDVHHAYLKQRGLSIETVSHFGLGYCSRGLMQGRIVIPLHDPQGQLIGYAGRLVDDAKVDGEHPKYLLPGTRERDGVRHEFHKSKFLFNGHRIASPVDDLVVCEGFISVFWLHQHGYRNVVALMGSSCSPEQATLISNVVSIGGRLWVFTDGDDAGRRCAESLLVQLAGDRFVRWVKLTDDRQPTDCDAKELAELLGPCRAESEVGDVNVTGAP